jgi:cysteine desulfurase/selenocysteine lyase
METVRAHERELTEYALEVLPRAVPDIHVYGPRSITEHSGIVTFNLPGIHPHDVATLLDRQAVAVRAGPSLHDAAARALGEAATVRASFNVYNDRDDIDRLADGLTGVARLFAH